MSGCDPTPRRRARTAAALAIVACACFKAVVSVDLFPGWDTDPTLMQTVIVGLTPTGLLVTDAIIVLAAAVVLAMRDPDGGHVASECVLAPLVLCGAVSAFLHAGFGAAVDLEGLALASSWSAAMAGAVALSVAARDAATRRVCIACVLGLVVMLAAKGVVQVAAEHPATVAMFRATKDEYLRAQGWAPDSMMARAYERRLMQAEATGWFGLANVFSTLMAGCVAAFGGLVVAAWKTKKARLAGGGKDVPRGWAYALLGGFLAAATGLVLAGSKGGYTAAGLGLLVMAAIGVLRKRRGTGPHAGRWHGLAWAIGIGVITAPICAVIVRGQVGERIGELSLLFRWFYTEAAARILAAHPLGVGPGGFKDAYLLAKNPLSPEDVSSPHSILFDWVATLGWAGLAWGGVLAVMVVGAVRNALAAGKNTGTPRGDAAFRPQDRLVFLTLAAATIAAALLERRLASPEASFVRVVGLLGGVLVGAGVVRVLAAGGAWVGIAIAGAVAAVAAHVQIEMTGTQIGACGWVFALLGLASARSEPGPSPISGPASKAGLSRFISPAMMAVVLAGIVAPLARVAAWEGSLIRGLGAVSVPARMDARRNALRAGPASGGDTPGKLATDVTDALRTEGVSISADDARWSNPDFGMAVLAERSMNRALDALAGAHANLPRHFGTVRAMARLGIESALVKQSLAGQAGSPLTPEVGRQLAKTRDLAEAYADGRWGEHAAVQAWLANVHRALAELTGESGELERAASAMESAASLAPHDLQYAASLAELNEQLGRRDKAKAWAAKALLLDGQRRLDPLTRLADARRRAMERLAGP